MPRIPYVSSSDVPASVRKELAHRPALNLYRMLPNAGEPVTLGFLELGRALLAKGALDPRLREIAILRVGHLSGASYEVHQHRCVAAAVGVSAEKIAAVGEGSSECFDETENALLTYVDSVVKDVKASEDMFWTLHSELGDQNMCELTVTIGFYMMVCRFLENFDVEIEEDGVHSEMTRHFPNND